MNFKNTLKRQTSPFFNSTMTYLIILVAFVFVRIFAQLNLLSGLGEFQDLVYSLIIQVGVIFGLSFLCYKAFSKKTTKQIFKDFRFKPLSLKSVFLCIGIGVCLIFINVAVNSILSLILSLFGYNPTSSTISSYSLGLFLITIFASAVLPGFCEEFANRGVLLSGLKGLGLKKAIVFCGLLFALMHLNVGQFGFAFLIGMYFAFLCIATGNIIPGMIIHFLNNAIVEYMTFARVNNLWLGDFYTNIASMWTDNFLTAFFTTFIGLAIVMFLFIWLTYLLIKETRSKDLKKITKEIADNLEDSNLKPQGLMQINVPYKLLDCPEKQVYYPSLKEKIPLWCCVFLGTVITLMTLIWTWL